MSNTQFYNADNATANLSRTTAPQSATRRPVTAPWIETGFVQIPIEFFAVAVHKLSKGAQRVYLLHCKMARTKGDEAGFSYAYRETLAGVLKCSLSTIDRANAELEQHRLIVDTGRRFRHGGAVKFQLLAPSKWRFVLGENDALNAQKLEVENAKTRPITKDKKTARAKKQQTPLRAEIVVADSILSSVPVPPTETPSIDEALRELDAFNATTRRAAERDPEEAAIQIERLRRAKNSAKDVPNPGGWFNSAMQRRDRDDTTGAASWQKPVVVVANAGAREMWPSTKVRRDTECHVPIVDETPENCSNLSKHKLCVFETCNETPAEPAPEIDETFVDEPAPDAPNYALYIPRVLAELKAGTPIDEIESARSMCAPMFEIGEWRELKRRALDVWKAEQNSY